MRILHTSDWHIGKRLGRYDRADDHRAALGEVVRIADEHDVDAVVVTGDLFDRPLPPIDALELGLSTLVRLTGGGRRPVVAIAGNHESPDLFEALAPLAAPHGVTLVGRIRRPDEGAVRILETPGGPLVAACFPFLREGRVVDVLDDTDRWYGTYATRVRGIAEAYAAEARRRLPADGVAVLCAHVLVSGVKVGGHGLPRGERPLHMGEVYAATPDAIPATLGYVALGHVHAPQPVPGLSVPAAYAGSLLELDFGEAGEDKRVVIVEAAPGVPATLTSVGVRAGRRLIRAEGTWDELVSRPELADAYVDLVVHTDGPRPEMADQARDAFPYLVRVGVRHPRADDGDGDVRVAELTWEERFDAYHRHRHGVPAPDDLRAAFREVLEAVEEVAG